MMEKNKAENTPDIKCPLCWIRKACLKSVAGSNLNVKSQLEDASTQVTFKLD